MAGITSADAVVGLLISLAILRVLVTASREIYRRLMDSVDPELIGGWTRWHAPSTASGT